MNCEQAQEAILQAENPNDLSSMLELAEHVSNCTACSAMAQRLVRLESAAAVLPAPGSEQAKRATLDRLRGTQSRPPRRLILRPMFISAVAAMLLIGIGLGAYFYNQIDRPAPPTVVDRLIDWNAELADAPASSQQAISSRAPDLEAELRNSSLTDDDRQLASNLLQHGNWLCVNNDPVDRAERFSDLADLILLRLNKATANNDLKAVQRLSQRYDLVVRAGIGGNLARVGANVSPENSKKLERIAKRNAEQERRLELMAERASKALQRELRQALETSKKQGKNLKRNGPTF